MKKPNLSTQYKILLLALTGLGLSSCTPEPHVFPALNNTAPYVVWYPNIPTETPKDPAPATSNAGSGDHSSTGGTSESGGSKPTTGTGSTEGSNPSTDHTSTPGGETPTTTTPTPADKPKADYPAFDKSAKKTVGEKFVLTETGRTTRVTPMMSPQNEGLMSYDDAQALMNLVTDENGRVLVADKDLYANNMRGEKETLYLTYSEMTADQFKNSQNKPKVSINYDSPGTGKFDPDIRTPVSHGVSVIEALIQNTNFNDPKYDPPYEGNSKRLLYPFHPGYLGKKGLVHLITSQKDKTSKTLNEGSGLMCGTSGSTDNCVRSFTPWIAQNFKILNVSFGHTLTIPSETKDTPSNNPILLAYNSWQYNANFSYNGNPYADGPTPEFKKALWGDPSLPIYERITNALAPVAQWITGANSPINTYLEFAKKGVFITKSYAEDNNTSVEEMSILYAVDQLNKQPKYETLWQSMVFVSAYDWRNYGKANYQSTGVGQPASGVEGSTDYKTASGFYSNICGAGAPICLVSYDVSFAPLSNGDWWGYHADKNDFRNPFAASGTSFAAPRVASVAALVRSVFPFASNFNLQTILLTTSAYLDPDNNSFAKRPTDTPYNTTFGWGLVQPGQAIYGPMMFYFHDFVADFTNNASYMNTVPEGTRYVFANDISGPHGLTVKGNSQSKPVLVLMGDDSYAGATSLQNNANLVVNGVVETSTITVDKTSSLAGNGQVASVVNNGTVMAEDGFESTDVNSAAQPVVPTPEGGSVPSYKTDGLYVSGNFTQNESGTLQARLGMPLGVGGNADLKGTLEIMGIASALLTNGTKYTGTVVVAKTASAAFNKVTSSSSLIKPVDGSVQTQDIQIKGAPYKAVTVEVTYQPAATLTRRMPTPIRVGAHNYDSLQEVAARDAHVNPGLYSTLLAAQNGSEAHLMGVLKNLSGDEFTQALGTTYRMSQFMLGSNQLTVMNTPDFNGVSVGAKAGGIFGLGDSSLRADYESVFLNFGTGRVRARVGVDFGNLKYKVNKDASERDNQSKLLGGTLFMTEPLGGFDVHFQLGYYRYDNTVKRVGSLSGKADTVVDKFKQYDVLFAANASYPFALTEHQVITPFVGAGSNISHLDGFTEKHATYALIVGKQNLQQNWAQLGAAYRIQNLGIQGLSMQLGYQATLPLNSSKQFGGAISTGGKPAPYAFNTPYDKVLQQVALDAGYHGEYIDLSTQLQATYLKDWALSVGARLEWKF